MKENSNPLLQDLSAEHADNIRNFGLPTEKDSRIGIIFAFSRRFEPKTCLACTSKQVPKIAFQSNFSSWLLSFNYTSVPFTLKLVICFKGTGSDTPGGMKSMSSKGFYKMVTAYHPNKIL